MREALLTIVVLSLAGCSSDDGGEEACSSDHRAGSYVQHMVQRSGGTCGVVTDQVVRLGVATSGTGVSSCADDAPDDLSADQCKLSRSYTCVLDSGATASWVAATTEHDGGATITGVSTLTVRDKAGAFECSSTYDVTLTRQ